MVSGDVDVLKSTHEESIGLTAAGGATIEYFGLPVEAEESQLLWSWLVRDIFSELRRSRLECRPTGFLPPLPGCGRLGRGR